MKKFKLLSLLLCCILLAQCAIPRAYATEETEETEESTAEETTLPVAEAIDPAAVPDVSYGNAPVNYGCRTLDGQSPLGGSERILETATSAFVYETTTQTIVYSYNPDAHVALGSIAKVMTALIAIESGNLTDSITVSTREISQLPAGAITFGLKNGEVVTVEDVLQCLIVESANDAALVLAEYVAGTEAEFVKLMNARASEIGCTDTVFVNCHGLDNAGQYTSARDVAKMTVEACKNPIFKELFGSISYKFPATNKREEEKSLTSVNYLMSQQILQKYNDQRVTGAMPSYVSPASGASITFTAEDKGMEYVMVIMGATRRYDEKATWRAEYYGNFEEAIDLLEYTFKGYKINRVLYSGQAFKTFQVGNGQNSVVGASQTDLDTVVPVNAKMSSFVEKYSLSGGGLSAPIKQGEQIATVQLWYGTSCIAETELYAMSEVRTASESGLSISNAASKESSKLQSFLGVLCLIVIVPVAVYLTYNSIMRSRMRARRRRRRSARRRSR